MNNGSNPLSAIVARVGTRHLDLVEVLSYLRSIIFVMGDAYSPGADPSIDDSGNGGCTYARVQHHKLVPVCIVGHLFDRLGLLGLLWRTTSDHYGACQFYDQNTMDEFWTDLAPIVTFDPDAMYLLYRVQVNQDSGEPWGEALTAAIAETREYIESRTPNLGILDNFSL